VANRLRDPAAADSLLEHIRAGGKVAAARAFGVSRVTLDKWILGMGPDFELEVERALADGKAWRTAARGAVDSILRGETTTRVPAPPPLPAVQRRVVVDAEPVSGVPGVGDDDDGAGGAGVLDLPRCPVSREGEMTAAELKEHIAYAIRHPDHPFARDALKIASALLLPAEIGRARREAEPPPRPALSGARAKVLEVLGRSKVVSS
jgi:hypothetical protein